jgi:hypothetical protein
MSVPRFLTKRGLPPFPIQLMLARDCRGLILASGGLFAGGDGGGARQRREALHGTSRSRIGHSTRPFNGASFEVNLRC